MREELVTVHFDGITHIDMTYGLAVQQMQKHIDKTDAEIARLNALLAEAREGLEMCERNDRSEPYGYANKGAPEASYRRAGDGAVPEVGKRWKTPREIARAILAKLGA